MRGSMVMVAPYSAVLELSTIEGVAIVSPYTVFTQLGVGVRGNVIGGVKDCGKSVPETHDAEVGAGKTPPDD